MDVEYPYAEPTARLNLLYRLPGAPEPRRLLVVGSPNDTEPIVPGWPAARALRPDALAEEAARGDGRFDAVALPWVLGDESDAVGLLRAARRLLVPGGVVVGHVANRLSLRRLAATRGGDLWRAWGTSGTLGSAGQCRRALRGAGFTAPECFFVQPSIGAPMGLIPCAFAPARTQFLRSVRASAGQQPAPAYALRWALAFAGLGGLKQTEVFFWARTPC